MSFFNIVGDALIIIGYALIVLMLLIKCGVV